SASCAAWRGDSGRPTRERRDGLEQLAAIDRLGQVLVITRFESAQLVLVSTEGRQRDGGQVFVFTRGTNLPNQFVTVFARHADIADENTRPHGGQLLERFVRARRSFDFGVRSDQHLRNRGSGVALVL